MITVWPAYSWIADLPASISVAAGASPPEVLTVTAAAARGLASSGAVLDVLAATLLTHTAITGAALVYDWDAAVPTGRITLTTAAANITVSGAEAFGVADGAYATLAALPCETWDGLFVVRSVKDLRYAATWEAQRVESQYATTRTQVRLSRKDRGVDQHVLVPGRYLDPRYAAETGYATVAGTSPALTSGTLQALVEAQLGGPRDTAKTGNTPWLWRHTGPADLAGSAIDIVLPAGAFSLEDLASPSSGGGRRSDITVGWYEVGT
jgi:hypothetical protein